MRVLAITGLSGSGRTSVLRALEDKGFFCIDNLPVEMLPGLIDYLRRSEGREKGVAVGIDMRQKRFLEAYSRAFEALRKEGIKPEVFFLEAETHVLVRRFEETGRRHPLAGERSLLEGIEWEKEQLSELRQMADRVIDTTAFNVHQLRRYVQILCRGPDEKEAGLQVEIVSFSFAKGLPLQADLVFDVRFLPNPYYEDRLRARDGRDEEVRSYIRKDVGTNAILDRFFVLIEDLVGHYAREDRSYFVLAVGCTGGRHRSVAVACAVGDRLRTLGYSPRVFHRDIDPGGDPARS